MDAGHDIPLWISSAGALVAASCAVFVARRDAAWRRTGFAQGLSARIDAARKAADEWDQTPAGLALTRKVEEHDDQLGHHGVKLSGLATKTDVAEVALKLAAQGAQIAHTAAGVDRIESMMMRRAFEDHSGGAR